MPTAKFLPIRPFNVSEHEIPGNEFTEVQVALINNMAWQAMMQLVTIKRQSQTQGTVMASLQEEAYMRGRMEAAMELLGVTEFDLADSTIPGEPDSSKEFDDFN